MRFGFHAQSHGSEDQAAEDAYRILRADALWAERSGFDYLSVQDHLIPFSKTGRPDAPLLDSWTALGAIAEATSSIGLLPLVINASVRHPSLIAKASASLDVVSGGRMSLGIGAGGYRPEHDTHGIPYPSASDRIARLSESVQIIRLLWRTTEATFRGNHHHLNTATISPRPVHQPNVLVAGESEAVLGVVARYADMANFILTGPGKLAVLGAQLDSLCIQVKRESDPVALTVLERIIMAPTDEKARMKWRAFGAPTRENYAGIIGSPDKVLEQVGDYERAGLAILFSFFLDGDEESRELFATKVLASLR